MNSAIVQAQAEQNQTSVTKSKRARKQEIKPFKHDGLSYATSLPFVKQNKKGIVVDWFNVKPTGDARKDYLIGGRCAELLVKAYRQDDIKIGIGSLHMFIAGLMSKNEHKMRFVTAGFFERIDHWLRVGAYSGGCKLDDYSFDQLIERLEAAKNA
jgi:hypothetical protein